MGEEMRTAATKRATNEMMQHQNEDLYQLKLITVLLIQA